MAEQTPLPAATNAATTMEQLQLMIAAFDAIAKGIEAQRQQIFNAQALAVVLGEMTRLPSAGVTDQNEGIYIRRTCCVIRDNLDAACSQLEELALNIEQHVSKVCHHLNAGAANG